ncbi:carbonic anhydrase 14 isoform X1 [Sinocyclocheilus rhinocerous]|uniref:carbonic anhydrase 14 isoform X1 n=1 Tax=Sinocyclocheilus rhinocerous TaxID=307959 RepID=UPI0007B9218C|nr:PREDICTED: carbonic anhydrase 14-like isoform X1 [Sinocyclocheilus rhinocerous]
MDLVWITVAFFLFYRCLECSGTAKEWTYAGAVGQPEWTEFFPDCGGSSQSPINVDTLQTLYDPTLIPVQPLGYNHYGKRPFTLYNNGHTVQMTLPHWMSVVGLPWHYSAVQLHLHWGSEVGVATGSEHTINGQSTAAELHIVHYNTEIYANMSEAKTQENGLAVLAILIEAGEEINQGYGSILNYLGHIRYAGQKVAIPAFDIKLLLPDNLSQYFRYNGSLTTPPCHQSVLWTIFNERVKISHSQLMKLQTVLYSSKEEEAEPMALQDNYRTTQPLNHRTVLSSFIPVSVKIYTAGEIAAIVIGSLCGCIGLAVIICFIVKTIRLTSSWDVLPSIRPAPQPRSQDMAKERKEDMALKTTTNPTKPEEAAPQPET